MVFQKELLEIFLVGVLKEFLEGISQGTLGTFLEITLGRIPKEISRKSHGEFNGATRGKFPEETLWKNS